MPTIELDPLWSNFVYHPHQETAIRWMMEQEDDKSLCGGFLCDEMGLGKTMEVLGLIKNMPQMRSLLLAPLVILSQWSSAAGRAGLNVFRVDPKARKWVSERPLRLSRPSLYIMHYECTLSCPSLLQSVKWDRLFMDEAHRLVNPNSKIHQRVLEISAPRRWVVTATPIINDIADARSLFKILGMEDYEVPRGQPDLEPLVKEKAICRTVAELREAIPNLPRKERVFVHKLPFETIYEEEFYRGIQGVLVRRWKALENEGANYWAMIKLLILLRQISVHPQVYINAQRRSHPTYEREDWFGESTKTSALKKIIEGQSDKPHRWLVFAQFHDEMEIIKESLQRVPRMQRVQFYSGKQTQSQREDIIQNTKTPFTGDNITEVLILQLHSGSVGLNLQHFDRIVFISPWWTAALMDQAVGRAVRIGQEETVEVHHLELQEEESLNIDHLMLKAVNRKRDLCTWFLRSASRGLEDKVESM